MGDVLCTVEARLCAEGWVELAELSEKRGKWKLQFPAASSNTKCPLFSQQRLAPVLLVAKKIKRSRSTIYPLPKKDESWGEFQILPVELLHFQFPQFCFLTLGG